MTFKARIDRFWMPPVPSERLAVIRILVGLFALIYLLIRSWHLLRYASFDPAQFAPVGVVRLIEKPLHAWLIYLQVPVTIVLAGLFMSGWRYRWVAPVFAASLLWTITYRNAWGMVFHTENLLVLHVMILALSPAGDSLAWKTSTRPAGTVHARYGWPLRLMCWVTVLAYMVAGVAKLKNAGATWISGDVLQVQVAYDNLRKMQLGDYYSPLGGLLVRYSWIWPPMAALSVVMEIAAPVAMLHERLGRWWSFFAWAFHAGVLALMAINFPYPLSFVAYAPFFRAERIRELGWVKRLELRFRGA